MDEQQILRLMSESSSESIRDIIAKLEYETGQWQPGIMEEDWLSSTEAAPLLRVIAPITSDRKLHVYVIACCRRIEPLLQHPDCIRVLDLRERFVEGEKSIYDLLPSHSGVLEELEYQLEGVPGHEYPHLDEWVHVVETIPKSTRDELLNNPGHSCDARNLLVRAVTLVDSTDHSIPWARRHRDLDLTGFIWSSRSFQFAPFIRDIFGNPFRPVAFDSRWQTTTAVGVAQAMYDARDFGAMPILADALQDAGCEDDATLNHCRDAHQVHVRGCWVVDLVLGKS